MEDLLATESKLLSIDQRLKKLVDEIAEQHLTENPTWHIQWAVHQASLDLTQLWSQSYITVLALQHREMIQRHGEDKAAELFAPFCAKQFARLNDILSFPAVLNWVRHFEITHPDWSRERKIQTAFRKIWPSFSDLQAAWRVALVHLSQELTGRPYYNQICEQLIHEATTYQQATHQGDVPDDTQPPLILAYKYQRYIALRNVLMNRGSDHPSYVVGVELLINPIEIHFQQNAAYQQALQARRQRAKEQSIDEETVSHNLKLGAAYQVLAVFDREFKHRFGNGVGDIEHLVRPEQLRWRDILHLFDNEVRKAYLADLLEQHYPTEETAVTLHNNLQALLDPNGIDPTDPDGILADVATLADPLELIEAQEQHATARENLAALLGHPKLSTDDRDLLNKMLSWVEDTGAASLNLAAFCEATGRPYWGTQKRFKRLQAKIA